MYIIGIRNYHITLELAYIVQYKNLKSIVFLRNLFSLIIDLFYWFFYFIKVKAIIY